MNERYEPWKLTPFEKWVQDEGLEVIQQQMVPDMYALELSPWERAGCRAVLLDLTTEAPDGGFIRNQGTIRYVCDIPPAGTFAREKHMYEEIFFVLSGRGATTVWYEGSPKHTFEWQEGSVFSIPLNAWHELYNGVGDQPARLYAATNAPTVFNLYASPEFVFECPLTFQDRFDPYNETYFSGKSNKLEDRFMETNFIANVHSVGLDRWVTRGPGANMMISMAGGHFICHLSEFPAGTYKKAHGGGRPPQPRSGLVSDVAYMFLSGEGYDLQWPMGTTPGPGVPWERIDYGKGSLVTPGPGFHQHFNVSDEPMRYIVLRYGNPRYAGAGGAQLKDTGGSLQIEFENEDPAVREMFDDEVRKRGVASGMPPVQLAR